MNNLEYFELYPNIDVYKNVLPDAHGFYDVIKNSEINNLKDSYFRLWDKWSHFGTYTQKKWIDEYSQEDFNNLTFVKEKEFVDSVEKAYDLILNDYVKEQLCDSFMTRFIGNVVTYTATQATQQRCNT